MFLVVVNAVNVGAYGELGRVHKLYISTSGTDGGTVEYWLASLKVATIAVFVIVGIIVNVGGNTAHEYIGGKNWSIGDAPFVGGFGGFARVFVTASFACGCWNPFLREPYANRVPKQTAELRVWESPLVRPRIRLRTCPGSSRQCSGGEGLTPRLKFWD